LSSTPGTVPVDHVAGLDQAPLPTLAIVGSAQMSGMPAGTPLTIGVCAWTGWPRSGRTGAAAAMTDSTTRYRERAAAVIITLIPLSGAGTPSGTARWTEQLET
jgi:hypothetical protein